MNENDEKFSMEIFYWLFIFNYHIYIFHSCDNNNLILQKVPIMKFY